jgi:hypothetical protein
MATDKGFADFIWQKMGPTCREHVREAWDLIERAPAEDRVKLLACFYWANWCRGRADQAAAVETYWDMR